MLLSFLFAAQIAVSSPGTTPQTQPWVDVDDRQAVVVWIENNQVRLSRIAFDGHRLDDGRLVAQRGLNPRIASSGVNHLIVWTDNSDVMGRFFTAAGDFLGDAFFITDEQSVDSAAVAWIGSRYIVAWSGAKPGAAYVGTNQSVDRFQVFGEKEIVVGDIAVAPAGNDAMIAYNTQDQLTGNPITSTISTLLVSDGMPAEVAHIIATKTTSSGNAGQLFVRTPRIAPHPDGFLLGWTQENGIAAGSFAFVAQLDPAGVAVGDPVMAGTSLGSVSFPPATATPVDDRVITIDYPSLIEETVDFICGCVTRQTLASAPSTIAPSFSNVSAATLPAVGIVVAYELGTREESEPSANARPRIFVQFLDVPAPPPVRRRPARH
jgi:hypothetical protein